MENQVKFVTPELSNTSTNEDVLSAIKQFDDVEEFIDNLRKKNFENYASFINTYRNIIKKNTPIVGKVYRVIDKKELGYWFENYIDEIEYMYVNFASLKKEVRYRNFMPVVKCIPLDKEGKPIRDRSGRGYLCMDSYDKGKDIEISHLSKEDYPEIAKVFKKTTSKKEEDDLAEYRRLQRKFEKDSTIIK